MRRRLRGRDMAVLVALLALGACTDAPLAAPPRTTAGPTTSTPRPPLELVVEARGDALDVFDEPGDAAPRRVLRRSDESSGRVVLHARAAPRADGWIPVDLAVRPNGSTGWVRRDDVTVATTPFRIEIDLTDRTLRVLEDDAVVVEAPIGIGAEAPPLPGAYFLRELLQPAEPFGDYGPYAYGLSGHALTTSSVLGGDGRFAIHGTSAPDQLSVEGGPGSVRVTSDVITYIAERLRPPLGSPVTVSP